MRAELEEPAAALREPARRVAEVLQRIDEAAYYGIWGTATKPRAIFLVAVGQEAEEIAAILRARGAFVEPPAPPIEDLHGGTPW